MTTDDLDKTEFARQLMKARKELVDKDYEIGKFKAVAWASLAIPLGLALCAAFYAATHHDAQGSRREIILSGDCANVRTEPSVDGRGAKVILPPGCHYKDNF